MIRARPGWHDTTSGRVYCGEIGGKETEYILLMKFFSNSNIATWFLVSTSWFRFADR